MASDMDRTKAVDLAITQIERQFGKGSIMRLGGGRRSATSRHPDRFLGLDLALVWVAFPGDE